MGFSSPSGVWVSSVIGFGLVDGQVRFRQIELEQVRAAGERQRTRWIALQAHPRLQQVRDLLAGEGVEDEGILERPRGGGLAVDLGEGEDLANVRAGIEAPGGEAFVVGVRLRRERQEIREQPLLACALALIEQPLLVIGLLDVLVALIAAVVACDEAVLEVDAHPIRIERRSRGGLRNARARYSGWYRR